LLNFEPALRLFFELSIFHPACLEAGGRVKNFLALQFYFLDFN